MKHAPGNCIGGTSVCLPLANEKGEMVGNQKNPAWVKVGYPAVRKRMMVTIHSLVIHSGVSNGHFMGIAIYCPCPVDSQTGANHNDFTWTGWLPDKVNTPYSDPFKYPVFPEIDAVVPRLGKNHLIQKKEWAFMARVGGMGAPVPGTCWMPSPKGVPMVSV